MKNKILLPIVMVLLLAGLSVSVGLNFKQADIRNRFYPIYPSVSLGEYDDRVYVSGVWEVRPSDYVFFGEREFVYTNISCDQLNAVCDEQMVRILPVLGDNSLFPKYDLFKYDFEYQIYEHAPGYIKARHIGAGRTLDLTINLNNKSAMLIISDTQDNPTASTGAQTVILGEVD